MTVRLIIEYREDGKVYVTGPIEQKQLCIDILDEAKRAVNNYKKTSIIVPGVNDLKKIK